jgi:4-carboxymuconolactone decarboxylase
MSNSSLNHPTVTDDSPAFELRGNRFKPLAWENMSAEQQQMTRAVLGGQRGNMQGPYNVLLRSPEVAGLPVALVQAISNQTPIPKNLPDDVIAVFDFCKELIQTRKVSDSVFAHVVKHFGERGVVDLMATMSYYTLVCMSLNVDDYPLPDGVAPELAAAWGPHP